MIDYGLPTTVEVNGVTRKVRSDWRAVLDIISALNDPELSQEEKAMVALGIFYEDELPLDDYKAGLEECFRFIDCGQDIKENAPKVVDWEQDFRYIVAPINRVAGVDIRSTAYMHWWTFVAYYYEIGDCVFAQIVRIRDKLARGKKLEKDEKEWYGRNRELVDRKTKYTAAEEELLKAWGTNG